MTRSLTADRRTDEWGRVILKSEAALRLVYEGLDIWELPFDLDPLIEQYNASCRQWDKDAILVGPELIEHSPEEEHRRRAATWMVPDSIKELDVRAFLLDLCSTNEQRARVNEEMDLYESRDLVPILQLMIYLVKHFRENKIVWGVGRGSSVASYCLYLIGGHKIDSLRYGLSINEFLK